MFVRLEFRLKIKANLILTFSCRRFVIKVHFVMHQNIYSIIVCIQASSWTSNENRHFWLCKKPVPSNSKIIWYIQFISQDPWLDSDFIPSKNKKSRSWNSDLEFWPKEFWICIQNNACMQNLSAWMHSQEPIFGKAFFWETLTFCSG